MGLENIDLEKLNKISAIKKSVNEAIFDSCFDLEKQRDDLICKINENISEALDQVWEIPKNVKEKIKDIITGTVAGNSSQAIDDYTDEVVGQISDAFSDNIRTLDRELLLH